MGTDGTSTPTNERELLVARSKYYEAMYDLLNSEVALYDAKAALADARSRRPIREADIATLQKSVHANEDNVTLAKANVTVASAAIERLQSTQDRRQTVAEHIGKLLLSPGSGLVDLIFVGDDDASDPLNPRSVFDDMFGGRSPQDFPPFISPFLFGENFPPRKRVPLSSLFDAWDDYDARRAAEANSDPDVGSPDKDQTPAG